MPYAKLEFPPGLFKNGTEYQSASRWYDGDLVRFWKGSRQPIGGWVQLGNAVSGRSSDVHTWLDVNSTSRAAVATNSHLYTLTPGGTLTDITPTAYTEQAAGSVWSLDNGGAQLFAVNDADGVIYEWSPGDSEAAALSGAPSCDALVMTDEFILLAIAAGGDPREVRWSDVRNPTQWTAAVTNFAGDFDILSSARLMCGQKVLGGTLVWSSEDLHLLTYVQLPDVYAFDRIADNCGTVSRHAHCRANDLVFWMGSGQFYSYAGRGLVRPMDCEIQDWVFGSGGLNRTYQHLVHAVHVEEFSEVWWYIPRGSATENTHVVVFNYAEAHWSHHALARTAGAERGNGFLYPLMIGTDGKVWQHENGNTRTGGGRYYLRSGPIELGNGDRIMEALQAVPDETTTGDVEVDFYSRFYPNASETSHGPYTVSGGKIDVRFSGRQAAIRFREKAAQNGTSGKIGTYRVKVQPGGQR